MINFLNFLHINDSFVNIWLESVKRCEKQYISMSDFFRFIQSENLIENKLHTIKHSIIQHIIGNKQYNIIRKRINYYTSNNHNSDLLIPKEKCFDYIIRQLFTHQPNPYYYDYKPVNRDSNDYNSPLIKVRKRFGYSFRPTRDSGYILKNTNSLILLKSRSKSTNQMSSCQNSKSMIVNNTSNSKNTLSTTTSNYFRFMYNHQSSIKKSTIVPIPSTSVDN